MNNANEEHCFESVLETSMGKSVNAQENKDSEYVRAVLRFVYFAVATLLVTLQPSMVSEGK